MPEGAPWGSTLSVPELAAIHSEGFVPTGQVMGCCVHQVYPYAGRGMWSLSRYGGWGTQELPDYSRALRQARRLALDRMAAEATGSHGVVGVRLNLRWLDEAARILEFTAIGTSIRAPDRAVGAPPFLSLLSGEGFAKLLRAGYVPCGVAIGVCALWSSQVATMTWGSTANQEVGQFSQAASDARSRAMSGLQQDLRSLGADGQVGSELGLEVHHWEEEGYVNRLIEFYALGTAVMRFGRDPADAVRPVLHV